MNKRQKLVQQRFLNNEKEVIDELKKTYTTALNGINENIKNLNLEIDSIQGAIDVWEDFGGDEEKKILQSQLQSKIYQKQYQKALQGQIDDVLDKMNTEQFNTVSGYLKACYDDGYIGTLYDLQGQGVPLIMPIDQESVVRAVQLDSKISQGLYNRMGEDVTGLKKIIASEVSRGIATGMTYDQVARQISHKMVGTGYKEGGAMASAMRIARTEGHRIQCQAGMDACYKAKDMGADVLKQWDSTLDGRTRHSHRQIDGEIREIEKPFSNGLMFPGDSSGRASEVVNCRCALLQRARWALDEDELQRLKDRAEYYGLDKSETFEEFKKQYIKANNILETPGNIGEKAIPYSQRNIAVDKRVMNYQKLLAKDGDYISGDAGMFKNQDLAILTAETGVEYTSLTIGDKSYLIRGLERSTTIPEELMREIIANKGTLDCHSHPFIGDLIPSKSDKRFLKMLTWQEESVIIDPTQDAVRYTFNGVVERFDNKIMRDDNYYDFLFEEGDLNA